MDLSANAIADWHAMMPRDLRAAIPNDARSNEDGAAAWLVADLMPSNSDIAGALARHAGNIPGLGAARRARLLAWIATRTLGSGARLEDLLADERLAALRPTIACDLKALAGFVLAGHQARPLTSL